MFEPKLKNTASILYMRQSRNRTKSEQYSKANLLGADFGSIFE
ncbi:hypothetical protein [Labilibaculum euxinus]|nr:hypothetical protein [Labilibaculum euxinus]